MKKRLREILSEILSAEDLAKVHNSYDIVGDIAIIRLTETSKRHAPAISKAIMATHKNVRTVLAQTSPVYGNFRLRKLECIAGENKKTTIHKEFGCFFFVNVEECYFSPRLSCERMRIATQVGDGEVIVNMFAGVGCFSVIIAKHSEAGKVYSIDINPDAVRSMEKNVRLNRVYEKVLPILGDAKKVIERRLCHVADRVLMPLPERAFDYIPYALLALKKGGGWIHYYDFEHAKKNENPIEKIKLKVAEELENLGVAFDILLGRVVRATGPNWYQIVLDIKIK